MNPAGRVPHGAAPTVYSANTVQLSEPGACPGLGDGAGEPWHFRQVEWFNAVRVLQEEGSGPERKGLYDCKGVEQSTRSFYLYAILVLCLPSLLH